MAKRPPIKLRQYAVLESPTLEGLDNLILEAEVWGYAPISAVASHYDGFFQSHSVMVKRGGKRGGGVLE